MIKNNRQYSILKKQIELLESEIRKYKEISQKSQNLRDKIQMDAFMGQHSEILDEIKDYENLIHSDEPIEISGIKELAYTIIKARLISGLSQKDLAEKLGIQQQQIQRYELDDYYKTSLERVIQICEVLNIQAKFIIRKGNVQVSAENKAGFLLPKDIPIPNLEAAIERMRLHCSLLN